MSGACPVESVSDADLLHQMKYLFHSQEANNLPLGFPLTNMEMLVDLMQF